MNPGIKTTPEFPRGETATTNVHVLKFGEPAEDGVKISLTMKTKPEAIKYTRNTAGTGGTLGIINLSVPQSAVTINGSMDSATSVTKGGIATFDLACTAPGNPRHYIDGQIYFLDYRFVDKSLDDKYSYVADDLVSLYVYDVKQTLTADEILEKFGRIYKIMNFLTSPSDVEQIDLRNLIKLLIEKPFTDVRHMPVTRDLSESARREISAWIDKLNNS